ncbi:MAG: DUF3786 domain-containing protein [Nitrospiraceae bacterium]|nr:MAG: DUF3786 domain-containing protein [Nitrospiraceae bacterium]
MWPGEEQAWDALSKLDHETVQKNALAFFDPLACSYTLICFGNKINITIPDRSFSVDSGVINTVITDLSDYSKLSILNYLVHAREIPLSEHLVRPADLSGGDIFSRGTHVLPLDKISDKYNNDRENFFKKGSELGGSQLEYGDMALRLFPLPRILVVLIVWSGDDEFPPRSSLLFDSSCTFHMPIDTLWSTAMLTVQMMLS